MPKNEQQSFAELIVLAEQINRSIDRADIALLEAGIAAVGSLEERIRALAADRDAARKSH